MRDFNSRGIAIAIVITMVLGSMLSLLGSENANGQERVNEIKITWGAGRHWHPSIFGDMITWTIDNGDIYIYNVETTEIRRESWGADAVTVDIYGKYVVYRDGRAGSPNWDIYILDTETGIENKKSDISDTQRNPRIWGDHVVWEEKDGDYMKIAHGDLTGNGYSYFNFEHNNQTNPDIWGRYVVFEDDENGNWDIDYLDIYDRTELPITTNSFDQRFPRIYGERVVWTDYRNGNGNTDIYMYDLRTDTETRITSESSNQGFPAIYDDIIVWQDNRMGNYDIFMMDLNDGIPIQVTSDPYDQVFPDIYGDIIVWEDHTPEAGETAIGYNIFMTHIDQDDDGIYDWDDPHPTIPHFPLNGLEYKMDMLMTQIQLTELNLTSKVQALRLEMAEGFYDLTTELINEMNSGVEEILADLDIHEDTLWGTNQTIKNEFAALKEELRSMGENTSMDEEEELALIEDYLEDLEVLINEIENSIQSELIAMELSMEEDLEIISANLTQRVMAIQGSLDELKKLDEIVTDLENVSRDVEKVESNTEKERFGPFEIIVIVLLLAVLVVASIGAFIRKGSPIQENEEDWG